ncbi:MAG: hypothetical protein QOJ27_153 [Sphingomonadales bacterium]|nr:hypothetical protein [Sphingomonadales bacterium]
MTEPDSASPPQEDALEALIEDLRSNRIDRRAFISKAVASGLTVAAASALATDALVQSVVPVPAEISSLVKQFENNLIELITSRGGGRSPQNAPKTQYQTVSIDKQVVVDID